MSVKFRISSSLKTLSKKILPLGFSLCLANSSVLTPTTTADDDASTEISILKKSLFDDFKISEQLAKRMLLLSTKYDKSTNYDNLNDPEKLDLFDVQNELFTQLKYNPFKKFIYKKPVYEGPVERPAPYYEDNRHYEQDPRANTEWWGVNLWVNLTESETELLIKELKKHFYMRRYSYMAFDQLCQTIDIIAHESAHNSKITFILQIIYAFAVVGGFFDDYFDWEHLSGLSNLGGGKISYRFTFGFIPSGVYPGYEDNVM